MSIFSLPSLPRADFADSPKKANRQNALAHIGSAALVRAHESLMGRRTLHIAADLTASQSISPAEIQSRQFHQLQALLAHARRNCPYFQGPDYAPSDSFRSIDDLRNLPLTTRSILRANATNMCRNDTTRILNDHTRGSTDEKLIYYWDRNRQAWDKANRIRGHAWHGFTHGHRELHLWPIDPPVDLNGQLRLAARRLRDSLFADSQIDSHLLENLEPNEFWQRVRRFNPARITVFPSALAAMIQRDEAAARNTRIPALRAIFLTGEVTYPWQRQRIEKTLRVPCFESYGVQEAGAIAYECPRRAWHICAESMLVEYVCDDRPARHGELAEVVVTGLQSHAMPLVRYRTGDIVRLRQESCGCGISLPVMPRVLGRTTDFLVSDDARLIEPAFVVETLSPILGAGEFQIDQRPIGSLDIRILDKGRVRPEIAPHLAAALQSIFGHRVAYTIHRVPRLTRTEFGKCRYVHSIAP